MTVASYTDNQFSNQVAPTSKHCFIRIFMTPDQYSRLADAATREKKVRAKLKKPDGGRYPVPTVAGMLNDAFSHMSNGVLDKLIDDLITRMDEEEELLK